jgi:hypothetical protein
VDSVRSIVLDVLSYFVSGAVVFPIAASLTAAPAPDFDRDIRPLLEKRCVMCHGVQRQMSGLRLDGCDSALKGGYSGPAIVPGNASASLIVTMVTTGREGRVMPPVPPRLTPEEISRIRAWIDAGAVWPGGDAQAAAPPRAVSSHWAFQSVRRPEPPHTAANPTAALSRHEPPPVDLPLSGAKLPPDRCCRQCRAEDAGLRDS